MKEHSFKERYKLHLWMTQHSRELEKFVGEWIAVSVNGVIAHGKSLVDLTKKPEVAKEDLANPVLFTRVPNPKYHYMI